MSRPELKFIPEKENHVQSEYAGGHRAKVQNRRMERREEIYCQEFVYVCFLSVRGNFSNEENEIVE